MWKLDFSQAPSPKLAVVFSLMVYPGAGQALNRSWIKAVLVALAFTLALVALVLTGGLGLWRFYGALTSLEEPISLVEALRDTVLPGVATVVLYFGAALEAWWEAGRVQASRPSEEAPPVQASPPPEEPAS